MARKKPEAVQALEALVVAKPKCAECDADAILWDRDRNLCLTHYASRTGANVSLPETLTRSPGETTEQWRRRAFVWLKANMRKIGGDA